jgi:hypothetical protein
MDGSGDAAYTQTIFEQRGLDLRVSWLAEGQTWDRLVNEMWQRYHEVGGIRPANAGSR